MLACPRRDGAIGVVLGFALAAAAHAQPAPAPAPEAVVRRPAVTVSAPARLPGTPLPPSEIPAAVQVLTGEELRAAGAVTLQDALARLPGLGLTDQQGNSLQPDLSFRGFPATPVTGMPQGVSVFVDGVRVNEPTVEEVNFDLIPVDDVERLELIRGPSGPFGRNALAGSLHIVTRRGARGVEVEPLAEGGSFGRQKYRLRASGGTGHLAVYVAGTFFREDGWRDVAAAEVGRAFAKIGVAAGGTDATLSFQYAHNRIEQPGSLPVTELRRSPTTNFTGGDFFGPVMKTLTFNLRQELGEPLSLAVNAFARKLDVEQFNASLVGPNSRLLNDAASAGGAVQLSHQGRLLGRPHRLSAGADYTYHDVNVVVFEEQNTRSRDECVADAIANGLDPAAACPERTMVSRVRDHQHAIGMWAQSTWELARGLLGADDTLVLTTGARWDWLRHAIEDDGPPDPDRASAAGGHVYHRLTPRIGINYNPSRDWTVYFSFAEGFRVPAFLELTCASAGALCPGLQVGVAPDPPLKAVKVRTYEVGLRARPLPWLQAELAFFRADVRDDIFSASPTGTIGVFFQNVGDTRRQGLEVSVRGTWARRLEARLDYAYTEATFRDAVHLAAPRVTAGCVTPGCTQAVPKRADLPLIPRHRVGAGLDWHVTSWLTLWLGASFVGEQRLRGDEENAERPLPAYIVVNGGARVHVKGFEGAVTVRNLLDNRYETFGTFAPNGRRPGDPIEPFLTPAPPINVLATASYRF